MKVIIDIEADGLKPTEIWCIVCKDIFTCHKHIFRNLTNDKTEVCRFNEFASQVELWIGHNILAYDIPVIQRLIACPAFADNDFVSLHSLDTFIVSKLVDYPREKHSIEDYGREFGTPKGEWNDFSKFSEEMVTYCVMDVDICHRVYNKYRKYIDNPKHHKSILLEHQFQLVVNNMEKSGFMLDIPLAKKILAKVEKELSDRDEQILTAFPPRLKLIREITPKVTKHGTLSRTDFRFADGGDLSEYNGGSFCRCAWESFNPSSHKQIIKILSDAGWSPVDKTKSHIETERTVSKLKRQRNRSDKLDTELQSAIMDLERLRLTGWKVSENNLSTLPESAPAPARLLAQRILYEARRRTLVEWLGLVNPDTSRVYGTFQAIGAWTHRMSHQKPNLANITNEFDTAGQVKLLGKELRQCWRAPKGRLLVGVDAEGIQLRIFAHYVNNPELIKALVNGDKKLKTDPHSYNQRVLGNVCKSRAAAKRVLYALLLGAGLGMLELILECSRSEAEDALKRLLAEYPGFEELKTTIIPSDAKRGWFEGIDGRKVRIPGEDVGTRRHKAMSGYLQNGEAVVMKTAAVIAEPQLAEYDAFIVDIIHDEGQNETPNDFDKALAVAEIWDKAIVRAGEIYELKCPMAGSYMNDHGKYTFGQNWYQTH